MNHFHLHCVGQDSEEELGPWHCPECLEDFKSKGVRDITLDKKAMRFVIAGVLPDECTPEEESRIVRATKFVVWENNGVYVTTKGVQKRVPQIG